VLSYGIAGAVVFRLTLILIGTATIQVCFMIDISSIFNYFLVTFILVADNLVHYHDFRDLKQSTFSLPPYYSTHHLR